jgi:hypothetical protein
MPAARDDQVATTIQRRASKCLATKTKESH